MATKQEAVQDYLLYLIGHINADRLDRGLHRLDTLDQWCDHSFGVGYDELVDS